MTMKRKVRKSLIYNLRRFWVAQRFQRCDQCMQRHARLDSYRARLSASPQATQTRTAPTPETFVSFLIFLQSGSLPHKLEVASSRPWAPRPFWNDSHFASRRSFCEPWQNRLLQNCAANRSYSSFHCLRFRANLHSPAQLRWHRRQLSLVRISARPERVAIRNGTQRWNQLVGIGLQDDARWNSHRHPRLCILGRRHSVRCFDSGHQWKFLRDHLRGGGHRSRYRLQYESSRNGDYAA